MSPSWRALRSATAASSGPSSTVAFQVRSVSVRVATYLGAALRTLAMGLSSPWWGQKSIIFS